MPKLKDIKTPRTIAHTGLCGYIVTSPIGRAEVYASTTFEAQTKGAQLLGIAPKKAYTCTVYLCERADGSEVLQSTCF
jgi:hypothetical protein